MYRLHSSLRAAGIDSKILCDRKTIDSPHIQLQHSPRLAILEQMLKQITFRLGLNDIHLLGSFNIMQHKAYVNTDILHFHGTHSKFLKDWVYDRSNLTFVCPRR